MAQSQTVGKVATKVSGDTKNGSVTYHWTTVVEWTEKEIRLDSNGWQTFTTKTRMNQASNQYNLGFTVYQHRHVWYVSVEGRKKDLEFQDNMTFKRPRK